MKSLWCLLTHWRWHRPLCFWRDASAMMVCEKCERTWNT